MIGTLSTDLAPGKFDVSTPRRHGNPPTERPDAGSANKPLTAGHRDCVDKRIEKMACRPTRRDAASASYSHGVYGRRSRAEQTMSGPRVQVQRAARRPDPPRDRHFRNAESHGLEMKNIYICGCGQSRYEGLSVDQGPLDQALDSWSTHGRHERLAFFSERWPCALWSQF
jgi:hypothetical protein